MLRLLCLSLLALALSSCSYIGYDRGDADYQPGNLGTTPSPSERKAKIAAEERGDFFYGRRYYVKKTRFWGYLRKPGQSAKKARLVIFNEAIKRNPDRLPEAGARKPLRIRPELQIQDLRTLYRPHSLRAQQQPVSSRIPPHKLPTPGPKPRLALLTQRLLQPGAPDTAAVEGPKAVLLVSPNRFRKPRILRQK